MSTRHIPNRRLPNRQFLLEGLERLARPMIGAQGIPTLAAPAIQRAFDKISESGIQLDGFNGRLDAFLVLSLNKTHPYLVDPILAEMEKMVRANKPFLIPSQLSEAMQEVRSRFSDCGMRYTDSHEPSPSEIAFDDLPEDLKDFVVHCLWGNSEIGSLLTPTHLPLKQIDLSRFPGVDGFDADEGRGESYARKMVGKNLPPIVVCDRAWIDGRYRVWAARQDPSRIFIDAIDLHDLMKPPRKVIGMLAPIDLTDSQASDLTQRALSAIASKARSFTI